MIEVTSQPELEEQLRTNAKVVALFYASWCPFCRSFISIFDKYAQSLESHLFMRVRIDEDENPMWEEFSLEAVPSVISFVRGRTAKRLDCLLGRGLNERQFREWLKTLTSNGCPGKQEGY